MIKKSRVTPLVNLTLEALLRRIPPDHPSRMRIGEELILRKSGYRGELSLDYYMTQLPRNGHYILQDLRLPLLNNAFFQIDSLLLSNGYFIIYEAKNHSGTLTFEEQQMLQTYEDHTQSYPNPVTQVENQQYHLESLIKTQLNVILPNASFVVVTNPSTIIKFNPQYEHIACQKVIRPAVVRQKSKLFWKNHQKPRMTDTILRKLYRLLINLDTPSKPEFLHRFHIKRTDIGPGVYCDHCMCLSKVRVFGTWKCTKCGDSNKRAHVPALIDYFLLIGNTITNRQFRRFLQLDSPPTATKLLVALDLPFDGTFKDRKYYLSLENLRKWL